MCVPDHVAGASTQRKALFCRLFVLGTALFPTRVVVFLGIFLWHILAVDPRCLFYAQNDLFLWNYRFLRDFLVVPGGPADWAGRLLLQACHFGWPGALILTAVAWLICILTLGFLKRLSTSISPSHGDWEIAWALPAIVLLAVHSQYDHVFSLSIGAGVALGAALGYAEAAVRSPRWRVVWFAGLGGALYYLAGAALYVFALCAMIFEFYSSGRRWATILGLIAIVVGVKCGVRWIFAAAFHPGLLYLHFPSPLFFREEFSLSAVGLALYASFPVCALLTADRASRAVRRAPDPAQSATEGLHQRRETFGRVFGGVGRPAPSASQAKAPTSRRTPKAGTVLLLAAAVAASQLSLRRNERAVLALHKNADEQKWDEVLRLATRVPPDAYSQYVRHDVNQALYHTGRLPLDLFSYPQSQEPFLTAAGDDPYGLRRRRFCDFLMQLGRVNDAEFFIHEDFVRRPSAEDLRRMARIAMVKNRPDMARLFLNVLRDDLIFGAWAEGALRRLREDPTLSRDAEIAGLRAGIVVDDDLHYSAPRPVTAILTVSPSEQMPGTLRWNPPNRMAFEFLMARYLVMRDVETVVRLLPTAASFGYPATPPIYEEAAMIHARNRKEKPETMGAEVVIHGCRISQTTLSKVLALDAATDSGRLRPAEIARVAGELGLTYFHYYYHQDNGT